MLMLSLRLDVRLFAGLMHNNPSGMPFVGIPGLCCTADVVVLHDRNGIVAGKPCLN